MNFLNEKDKSQIINWNKYIEINAVNVTYSKNM